MEHTRAAAERAAREAACLLLSGHGEKRLKAGLSPAHLKAVILLHQLLLGEQVLGLDVLQTGRPFFTLPDTQTVKPSVMSSKRLNSALADFSNTTFR